MKKILLTTIATTLIATSFTTMAKAKDGFSGNTNIWAWTINVPPLKQAAKIFMKAHPNAHIKITNLGHTALLQKLSAGLMARGKGLPDATLLQDNHFDSFVRIYPRSFVNVGKMGYDKLANLFPTYKANAYKYKSHMYGFPFDGGPAVIFYRRSTFAKAGVKPSQIKTWEDYLKYGKIIKAKTGKFMFGGNDDDTVYRLMIGQYGKGYFDAKGNIDMNSPRSIKALKLIKRMQQAGIIHHRGTGWTPYMRDIASGTISALPQGIWLAGNIEMGAPKTKGDWGVMLLPKNGDGDVAAATQGGSGFLMFQKSKNKQLTYNFLKYYTTTVEAQTLAFKGGLFPSLLKMQKTNVFKESLPFFKGQKIWLVGAKALKIIKTTNFTEDYYYANLESNKLFTGVIFDNKDLLKRLDQTAQTIKARTGRKVNKY